MRSAAKAIIFNVYKYFERQALKSKCRGPSQVTRKTIEATMYPEQTVWCIAGEKASLCGAMFTSPAKLNKVDRTVCLVISMWKPYGVWSMISTARSTLRSTRCC